LLQDEINDQFLSLQIIYSQLSCSDKGATDGKGVTFTKDTTCLLFRRNKQRTIALSSVPVRTLCFETCSISEICPTKYPHQSNNRTVEELEEDADCKTSVCKQQFDNFISVVLQPSSWLGWMYVEVPRSQTFRNTHPFVKTPLKVCPAHRIGP
jgi:hypothetical protein